MPKRDDRRRVNELVAEWKQRFYLHGYEVKTVFSTEADADEEVRAHIRCRLADTYHLAEITFYPVFFDQDAEEQERAIVHELAHVPIEILSHLIDQQREGVMVTPQHQEAAVERVTDWLANVIFYSKEQP